MGFMQVRGRTHAEKKLSFSKLIEVEESFFRKYLKDNVINCQSGLRALTDMLLSLQANALCKAAPSYMKLVGFSTCTHVHYCLPQPATSSVRESFTYIPKHSCFVLQHCMVGSRPCDWH